MCIYLYSDKPLFGVKSLTETMLTYLQMDAEKQNSLEIQKHENALQKVVWNMQLIS